MKRGLCQHRSPVEHLQPPDLNLAVSREGGRGVFHQLRGLKWTTFHQTMMLPFLEQACLALQPPSASWKSVSRRLPTRSHPTSAVYGTSPRMATESCVLRICTYHERQATDRLQAGLVVFVILTVGDSNRHMFVNATRNLWHQVRGKTLVTAWARVTGRRLCRYCAIRWD